MMFNFGNSLNELKEKKEQLNKTISFGMKAFVTINGLYKSK